MFREDLLLGKVAIITGGGTGLGKSMARRFAVLGADVAIVSRNKEHLESTMNELKDEGYSISYRQCDIRDPEQIEEAVDSIIDEFGKVDILVNNAAGNFVSKTEMLSPKAFDTILKITLNGTVYFTLEMGKRWINSGSKGTILNMIATYAWTGSAYVVPSATAKAGVLALTRSLAVEWGPKGIRTVAIAPGPFPTGGSTKRLLPSEDMLDLLVSRNPSKRLGTHAELANLAAFLVSDEASFINGEVITIDGGEWLGGAGQFNMLSSLTEDAWEEMRRRR